MDMDSMAGRMGRMDRLVEMGIVDVDVFFCDVSHNYRNLIIHHHRICHIDRNQIVSLFSSL